MLHPPPDPNWFTATLEPSYLPIPFLSETVSAGQSRFSSPAQDYDGGDLDLNRRFIINPPSMYIMRVKGDSMIDAHIPPDSMVIVNASLPRVNNAIVVASIDGSERMVKRLDLKGVTPRLLSENAGGVGKQYDPIVITEEQELFIYGVVANVIITIK